MNKLKNLIKNHWIGGILILAILSSFASPVITLGAFSVTLVVLLGRLVLKRI
ncbi:MAG: hypothetical protein KBC64_07470 [Simkaniaceae bacterium]|nr:hypothetical protein [Simkaniaceae bacterium]